MEVLIIVLPLALLMAGSAVTAFILAVRSGQFDDLDTPAVRAALDDDHQFSPPPTVERSESA